MGFTLYKVGRRWHFQCRVGGKRLRRTTREETRARAEEVAFAIYRRERLVKDGRGEIPTVSELAALWLRVHAATASRPHLRAVGTFAERYLYGMEEVRIDRLMTQRVEEARARHLRDHAPASANQWLAILRLLYGWASKRGWISEIPWRVSKLKLQKKPRVTLPAEKAVAWLAAVDLASGKRTGLRTAVRLMVGLGLREGEALSARWEWLDQERALYTPGETKGREAEPIPVAGWLVEYLEPLRKPEGLVVESPASGCAYRPGATGRVILAANAKVGTPGVTAHRLRGTFATLLSEEGVPIQTIQKMMRHKSPLTTMHYLEPNAAQAAAGVEAVAARFGFGRRQVLDKMRPAEPHGA